MKIGIVGSADRAVAWENHLRPHQSVSEVVISSSLQDIGNIDACLIIDDSDDNLEHLLTAIRAGHHTFLISKLPTDTDMVEKVYHAAEEANVLLQFSHWPTLAPASQWMAQRISKPRFLQIVREISHTQFMEMEFGLQYFWIDELAFCLRWIDGAVHHLDINQTDLQSNQCALQLFLRFDSGTTASIYIHTCASENRHQRMAADHTYIADCDVLQQRVRLGQADADGHLFFERKTFDASDTAESAATQFLKAVQLNKSTLFNGYHALRLCQTVDKIKKRLVRV